jgi:outer membrane protein, heavy metal efflux system
MKCTFASGIALAVILSACLSGCSYDTQDHVDRRVGFLGGCPMDTTLPPAAPLQGSGIWTPPDPISSPLPDPPARPVSRDDRNCAPGRFNNPGSQAAAYQSVAYEAPAPAPAPAAASTRPTRTVQPLEIPRAIPGSAAPPLRLPPVKPGSTPEQQRSEIEALFADLEVIPPEPEPGLAAGQTPLTLAQLQAMAVTRNPLIRQAASDVEAARGNMIQAGAYPNSHVGYQADTINTGATAGYQGGAIAQTIVTGGKLRLAKVSAAVDLKNAELALSRARYDLATQVRSNYLGVLVARERIKVNDALTQFANRAYRIQVRRVSAGQAAA